MLYTVSDDGSFIANCELYILDKRFYICLLGQDLLQRLYYMHLRNTKELLISNNVMDLKRYIAECSG